LDLSYFRIASAIALTAVLACNASDVWSQAVDATLKLNQIQVIGTHNSYHAGIAPNESKICQAKYADAYKGLDYQHQPLPQQFDSGSARLSLMSTLTAKAVSTRIRPARRWLLLRSFRLIPTSIPTG